VQKCWVREKEFIRDQWAAERLNVRIFRARSKTKG